jgi:Pyruvate/2-oxoacid:ferredoxin oxidoreductase gamma subunit
MARGGLVIYDSSLIDKTPTRDDVAVIGLPATAIADEIGSAKAANMVALGAFIERTRLLDPIGITTVVEAMTKTKNRSLLELNLKAIDAGRRFVQEGA